MLVVCDMRTAHLARPLQQETEHHPEDPQAEVHQVEAHQEESRREGKLYRPSVPHLFLSLIIFDFFLSLTSSSFFHIMIACDHIVCLSLYVYSSSYYLSNQFVQ